MSDALMSRMHAWVTEAPWLAVIMFVGLAVIFWGVLGKHDVAGWAGRRARWLVVLAEAVVVPLLFFAMLWGIRVVLARTEYDFRRQHGRVSETNLASVQSIWGKPHVQRDLVVQHSYKERVKEEVRDQFGRVVTRERWDERYIDQNSVAATRGEVTLTRSERQKGSARYPGYKIDCRFRYNVKNYAERATTANFVFPLSPGQSLFDKFTVFVDGVDMSARLHTDPYSITWDLPMQPGEAKEVEIAYRSRGLERFYYQVSDVREIRDFLLTLRLPDIPHGDINYPEGCIPPTEGISALNGGRGSELSWRFEHALTTRGMGIALPRPEQPGEHISRVLRYAWRGGMLLLVTLAVTLLALGQGFSVPRMALLAGVYVGEFMLLAALSDHVPSFWLAWAVAAVGAMVLATVLLGGRRMPVPALMLLVIFLGLYPLLTLPEEWSASLLLGVDVLTIVYLAVLGGLALRQSGTADQAE